MLFSPFAIDSKNEVIRKGISQSTRLEPQVSNEAEKLEDAYFILHIWAGLKIVIWMGFNLHIFVYRDINTADSGRIVYNWLQLKITWKKLNIHAKGIKSARN